MTGFEIPEREPGQLVIGDRWRWKRKDLNDFPAPTWTLKYVFASHDGGLGKFTLTASADGDDHEIDEAKADTTNYGAGLYRWQALVDDGTSRHIIDEGFITLEPDPETAAPSELDQRSIAKRMVDLYESFFESRISADELDQQSYSVAGRSLAFAPKEEVRADYRYWRNKWINEQRAQRARKGRRNRDEVLIKL